MINATDIVSDSLSPAQRFGYAVSIVLQHEGFLTDNKRDPGLVTKWGISLRFLSLIGMDINHDGHINAADVMQLSRTDAMDIYKHYWWDKYRYNTIENLGLATKIFDIAVNTGPSQAHKLIQISINRMIDKPIAVDGKLGPITFGFINTLDNDALLKMYCEAVRHFYINLVADKPDLNVFLKGWLNRAAWPYER